MSNTAREVYVLVDFLGLYPFILDNLSEGIYFVDRQLTITYWTKGAERLTGFSAAEVVGRHCGILAHCNEHGVGLCGGYCPLSKVLLAGGIREDKLQLRHKNGQKISTTARTLPIFDTTGQIAGAVHIFGEMSASGDSKINTLAKMAFFDHLTELGNRKYGETKLAAAVQDFQTSSQPFGVLLLNVKDFKKINDQYGQAIGDELLKLIGKAIAATVSVQDTATRWHGARFLIVSTKTKKSLLLLLANKIRNAVFQAALPVEDKLIQAQVSVGGTMAQPTETCELILERAEKFLRYNETNTQSSVTIDIELDD